MKIRQRYDRHGKQKRSKTPPKKMLVKDSPCGKQSAMTITQKWRNDNISLLFKIFKNEFPKNQKKRRVFCFVFSPFLPRCNWMGFSCCRKMITFLIHFSPFFFFCYFLASFLVFKTIHHSGILPPPLCYPPSLSLSNLSRILCSFSFFPTFIFTFLLVSICSTVVLTYLPLLLVLAYVLVMVLVIVMVLVVLQTATSC